MSKRHGWVVVGAMIGAVGCNQAPPPEQTSYLLLDQQAREAGFVLEGAKAGDEAVLPIEVEPAVEIGLLGPAGRVDVKPEAGKLVLVHGAEGLVETRALGHEVDVDKLVVHGSEAAARELADVLAGQWEKRDDGSFEIRATNALGEASRIHAPAGLFEILPGQLDENNEAKGKPAAAAPAHGADHPSIAKLAGPAVALPGAESSLSPAEYNERFLPAAVSCNDPATGVWKSYAHHPELGEWYAFTMTVRRDAANPSVLVGEITSEFWEGDHTRTAPACGDDVTVHGAVKMPARGAIHGSTFSFGGLSHAEVPTACSRGMQNGYNDDQFSGQLQGSRFVGVNNDGGRSVNDPTEFRRVACF